MWSDEEFYHSIDIDTKGDGNTSTDSENVPLSKLARQRRPVKRKLIHSSDSESEKDDSFDDETYNPSKADINSSDSEQDVIPELGKRRSAKVKGQRMKGWKKKPTRIKTRKVPKLKERGKSEVAKRLSETLKLLRQRRKRHCGSDLERAKEKSKRMQSVRDFVRRSHLARLDAMLASNELKRVGVYGDGNCIFAAMKKSGQINDSIDNIRTAVCDLMTEQVEKYAPFCRSDNPANVQPFLDKIEVLKSSGTWNMDIADVIPMALSNKFTCNIRIYSSSISAPVIDIKPDQPAENLVNLAYLSVQGHEHYDAIVNIGTDDDEVIDLSRNERQDELQEQASFDKSKESNQDPVQTTPHKRASYQSPQKKHSSRKRKRDPGSWKKNIRKAKRSSGKAYTSATGRTVDAKQVQPHTCSKCKFKCGQNFTEEQRQSIFTCYYGLGNYERQRQFICEMVERKEPSRKGKCKKKVSQKFHLVNEEKKVRVCRDFFLKTLDIGRKTVDYSLQRKTHGTYGRKDMRGTSSSANKLDQSLVDSVKRHIESFPKMESHYARKQSTKEYLSLELNIKKMWQLYKTECEKKDIPYVTLSMYRTIFCECYNLSFYKPKKDQCSLCTLYMRKREAGSLDETLQKQYDEHQIKKEQARKEKESDKLRSKTDKSVYVATFDLQAVLSTPCTLVSELYYSRKLCCYNLTIYSLGDKNVVCHVWDESQAKRGSCEIATCLMKNTLSVCKTSTVKEIVYFSDSCGGQNRNQYVTASLLYTLSQAPQLERISHKFLVSGHSQMECDSVHSTIEGAKKITPVYVPSQWCTLISMARKTQPYITVPLKYNHVVDFKDFVSKHCKNLKTTTDGQKVNWLQVKWIQVRRESPKSVFVNYSFDTSAFLEIQVQKATRVKGRDSKWPENEKDLNFCYSEKLPISILKKNDLVNLCKKDIIPEEFHSYFSSLPTDRKQKDYVPLDSEEEDTD